MAFLFADRVRVVTATTGTGTINLGLATVAFRSFAQAVTDGALASGCQVYYAIQDGINWECGTGTYTAGSPDTLTRVVNSSSAGGTTAISLSGSAQVALTQTQLSTITALFTSGVIDNTTIGATIASTGAFTTLLATTSATVPTVSFGDSSTNASTTAFVANATTGVTSVATTGGTTTLTAVQASTPIQLITGTLTSNAIIVVPNSGVYTICNRTSGAYTVTVKTASGTGYVVPQGINSYLIADGTNVLSGRTDFNAISLTSSTIDSSTIGASTPSTGAFTTLSASTTATAPTVVLSDSSTNVATTAFVQGISGGLIAVSVAGSSNVTLSSLQAAYGIIQLTGALTGNIQVIVPTASNKFIVENSTSGAYTITVKTSSGTGVTVAQGFTKSMLCDGVNVVSASSDQSGVAITSGAINATTIGASTASTGAFTTLTASSTVSGSGFTTLLSPYATLSSPTLSGTPLAPTAALMLNNTQIATTAYVQGMTDGVASQAVSGSNVTLAAAQAGNPVIVLSGTLTANITVSVPSGVSGNWIVFNNSTGAFTITFIYAGGTGVVLTQGAKTVVYYDGSTTVSAVISNTASAALEWTGGTVLTAGTYFYTMWAPYNGTITTADLFMASGTSFTYTVGISANAQTAGTAVTNLSAVSFSTVNTQSTRAATGANTFTAGQCISLVIASPAGSPTGVVISLRLLKTS